MDRRRVGIAAGIAVLAIVAVAIAWLQDVPELSADDAVTAAQGALDEVGLEADVEPDPRRTTYTADSGDPIEVWTVRAEVRSERIELYLATADARPVSIDDRTEDRASFVLTAVEHEAVGKSVDDPARPRAVRRNISFSFAAALVVALAIIHAALAAKPKEPRR